MVSIALRRLDGGRGQSSSDGTCRSLRGHGEPARRRPGLVRRLIEDWPDKAPALARLTLYVRADQAELWSSGRRAASLAFGAGDLLLNNMAWALRTFPDLPRLRERGLYRLTFQCREPGGQGGWRQAILLHFRQFVRLLYFTRVDCSHYNC